MRGKEQRKDVVEAGGMGSRMEGSGATCTVVTYGL